MAFTKRNALRRGPVTRKFQFFQEKIVMERFPKIIHRTARL